MELKKAWDMIGNSELINLVSFSYCRFYRLVKFDKIYCFIFILIYFVVIHMLNIYIVIITYILSKITTTKSVKFVRILFHIHAIKVVLKIQIYPLLHL